ncbi:MAG: molybdenum cofactor guanylyltransferase [Pyrinomonadaceae bacterium]|nr:molybdenum cofactor guanylyltransferase [Pyrinomonadaceae bacterium]
MGKNKALLQIEGKTFLEIATEKIRPFCKEVFVIINRSQEESFRLVNANFVFDAIKDRGALGGIYTSLKFSSSPLTLVLAVDLPLVEPSFICRLIRAAIEMDTDATVSIDEKGFIQPLCAIYRTDKCLPKAEKLILERENASVKDFLAELSMVKVTSKTKQLLNVNTTEEYEEALKLAKTRLSLK